MFEFANRGTVLTVSSENGAVLSVTAGGKAVTAEADRAFRLRLLDGSGDAVTLDDRDFRDFSSDGGELLRWRGCRKFSGLEMRLRIRPAEDGSFRFRPAVAGIPGGYRLEWVSAPLVKIPPEFMFLHPRYEGMLFRAGDVIDKEWEKHFGVFPDDQYPGSCQMQFFAAYAENSGIYCAADDPGHAMKFIGTAHRAGDAALEAYFDCFCGTETPGPYYELPYELILRPFSGDWQHACAIYREWVERDPAVRQYLSLPDWLKDSPVVIICPMRGGKTITDARNRFLPYEKMFPRIRELAKEFGSKVMVLLMRWDHNGPWMPPYYWPPVGGAESFRKFRDLLHGEGHLLGVYGSGTYFTLKSLVNDYSGEEIFEREHLAEAMVADSHGETERRFEPIRTHTAFCITEEAGRRIMAEQVRIMADEKVDFFQFLDQNIGGAAFPCYRADHHHPSVPGRAGTDAMRGFLRELNAMIRDRKSSMILGTEAGAAGPFVADLPFNDLRAHFADGPHESSVPAYQYVFHRHLNNFFGNSCIVPNHTDGDCLRFRMARGFCGGSMLTVVLRDSGEIDWGASVCDWSEPAPDQREIVTLVRNLNRARRRFPEFLRDGDMIPSPAIECGSRVFSTLVENAEREVPEILGSAWRAPDGQEAVFLVNYLTRKNSCRLNGKTVEVPPLDVVMIAGGALCAEPIPRAGKYG